MAAHAFSGGKALEAKLRELAKKVGKAATLRVGFLENATYPDGKPVAMVAAIQEFGAPAAKIPSRPFFRNMVAAKSPNWGESLGNVLKGTDYDAGKALAVMGESIKGQLVDSIVEINSPALSPTTLMLRKMRSEDQGLVVTGKTVGEAARRVADGESYAGVSTAVLIDSGHLQNSVDYEVKP
jgi:hypothetical protein